MKRFLLHLGWTILVLLAVTVVAFKVSPWPSVFLIARASSGADQASELALARHVPEGIAEQLDVPYGPDPAERLDVFYPATATGKLPTIIWIHGGAWIAGSKERVANYLRVLAGQGFTVVGVEYSTGYGSTYPAPIRQSNAALAYLVANAEELHIDPDALLLAGDSAGAQIAAQLALLATDQGYSGRVGIESALAPEQLKGTLLFSGAYDIANVKFEGTSGWFVRTVLWAYSGTKNFMDDDEFRLMAITPHVTPRFPPTFISSGNGDPLLPQAVELSRHLERLDVPVTPVFFPETLEPALPHEFQFDLDTPQGQEVLERSVRFAKQRTAAVPQQYRSIDGGCARKKYAVDQK